MDKLQKCHRGDDCFVCRDLTEEEIQRLKELFEREQQTQLEIVELEK